MTGKPNGEANSQSSQLDEEELQKLEAGGNVVNVSVSLFSNETRSVQT